MEIPNPRRILVLSPPSVILTPLLNALTPPPPPPSTNPTSTPYPASNPSTSTTTPAQAAPAPTAEQDRIHHITTPYYRASIPIWTDTVPSPSAWAQEWLSMPGAGDVVAAVGAWVVGFAYPLRQDDLAVTLLLQTVADVLHHYTQNSYDIEAAALLAVALPPGGVSGLRVAEEEWEDLCRESGGWEFVDGAVGGEGGGRNEYGETTGLPRLLEALTTIDWDSGAADAPSLGLDLDFDDDDDDPAALLDGIAAAEAREMNRPMLPHHGRGRGARDLQPGDGERKLTGGGTEDGEGDHRDGEGEGNRGDGGDGDGAEDEANGVEALQALLLQMQAVRDMSAEVPAAERRRWAARAVRDVMRGM